MAMHLLLRCTNLQKTRDFYANVLGFEVTDSADGTCTVRKDQGTIVFTEADLWNGAPALTGTIYFFLADVDDYHDRIRHAVDIQWPLQEMHYGTREFGIVDCNGYHLAFAQDRSKASP